MRTIALFGSTGSVGSAVLRVVRHLSEELKVVALAARSNLGLLEQQAREFCPELIAIGDSVQAARFRTRSLNIPIVEGEAGLCEMAALPTADYALFAMSGIEALKPAFTAIEAKKMVGLANKELLVSAGSLMMQAVRTHGTALLPIDSEHSALFQCLHGHQKAEVRRLILTASGGPFRTFSEEELHAITIQQALAHPNWSMGPKITIDSSTLMNKGLELIEAHWLFDMPPDAIDVVVHPQSMIHSFVEFCDGSILAQLSEPDMALPIQYALTYPKRKKGIGRTLNVSQMKACTFECPDRKKFPCLALAEEALRKGGSYPCVLNAANEVLVQRFLKGELRWIELGSKLEQLMSSHSSRDLVTLEAILAVDREMRRKAEEC
jgi:1-deoxy-D-xylulose-5-phosphate reductoisomerase